MRRRIDHRLNTELEKVEQKRERQIAMSKKLEKMADNQEKRRLVYQQEQKKEEDLKRNKTPAQMERALHESYQIVIKVQI